MPGQINNRPDEMDDEYWSPRKRKGSDDKVFNNVKFQEDLEKWEAKQYKYTMTFEEIFNEPGLYVADGFAEGNCFRVNDNGELLLRTYEHINDMMPLEELAIMHKNLFDKKYKKVLTRQSLFK